MQSYEIGTIIIPNSQMKTLWEVNNFPKITDLRSQDSNSGSRAPVSIPLIGTLY